MEAKLKSLRVADLRDILQKASVGIPTKSNKSDLIAKILASPAAVEAFSNPGTSTAPAAPTAKPKAPESSHGGQDDDLLAPPEEFDWGSASNGGHAPSAPEGLTTAPPKPATTKPLPVSSQKEQQTITQESSGTKGVPLSTDTTGTQDVEMERRKKRAARFGIPLVESKPKAAKDVAKATSNTAKSQNPSAEEVAKIEGRAARFGVPKASATATPPIGQKRAREPAPVDSEEMERRKKRAERFSTGGDAKAQG